MCSVVNFIRRVPVRTNTKEVSKSKQPLKFTHLIRLCNTGYVQEHLCVHFTRYPRLPSATGQIGRLHPTKLPFLEFQLTNPLSSFCFFLEHYTTNHGCPQSAGSSSILYKPFPFKPFSSKPSRLEFPPKSALASALHPCLSVASTSEPHRTFFNRYRQADNPSSSKSQNCSTHATITPGKRHEGGAHLRKFLQNCHQTRESTELRDFCPHGRNYSDSAARATSIIYVPISGAKHSERPQQPLRGRSRLSSQSGKFFAIYDSTSLKSGRIDIINRFHKSTICTMPQWNTY